MAGVTTGKRARLGLLLAAERRFWRAGVNRVAGVDEAGAGPLAGPLVAAAVVTDPLHTVAGVDDSKRLDPTRREDMAAAIRATARDIGVGVVSVEEIDAHNVYQAGLLAMRRAVAALEQKPEHLLVDARTIPDLDVPQTATIKGDARHYCIAAASIIAKTHRDSLMISLDSEFPEYGFAEHKGYATPEHQAAIRRLGPCSAHRGYSYIRELTGGYSSFFYDLLPRIQAASNQATLASLDAELVLVRPFLDAAEHRKLRLALRRCRSRADTPA